MDAKVREAIAAELRQRRQRLWEEAIGADTELRYLAESRESELEEMAQRERAARLMARLDLRAKHETEEIDAALARIADGVYGVCAGCGREIPVARLRALPATRVCVRCARRQPSAPGGEEAEAAEPKRPGAVPADRRLLSDRELEAELRELLRSDERIDMDELRVVCRHGVVYLAGVLPSEAEHQAVLQLLTDCAGMTEVVDRLRIQELLWERPERSKAEPVETPQPEPAPADTTEDVVKSAEEGLEYVPPERPPEPEE